MTHRAPIVIAEYDPAWPERFERERERLFTVFDPATTRIEHVGSTSVPGLAAKPILDIMVGAPGLEDVIERIPAVVALGYQYVAEHEASLPERRFFALPPDRPRAHHVHAVAIGSAFFERHLLFRDLLRRRRDVSVAYERLKRRLAVEYGDDREGYTEAKGGFVEAAIARARAETGREPS